MAVKISNRYVVDGSFLLAFLLPDEHTKQVDTFFEQLKTINIELIAPTILPYEVVNGIRFAVKSKRLDQALATKLIRVYLDLPVSLLSVDYGHVYTLSRKHNLTVYDASYLWLAKTKHLQLLTLDKTLQNLL